MNGLALCAGHGGLELGLHIAEPEYRTVCYVEREAYQAAALVARMEDQALDCAPVWDDVKTFDGHPWRGKVDIVTGGYPCQPFSTAGQRRGADDPRHIWPDIKRIVKEIGPEFCFFENVANHLNLGFYEVAQDLRSLGYQVAADLVSAKETGASHHRLRLFIVAHRESRGQRSGRHCRGAAAEHAESDNGGANVADATGARYCAGRSEQGGQVWDQARRQEPDRRRDVMADTGGTGSQGGERGGPSGKRNGPPAHGSATELRRAWLPLFAPGPAEFAAWAAVLENAPYLEPAVRRMADGLADELDPRRAGLVFGVPTPEQYTKSALRYRIDRLRGGGNGVSPLAAAYAWRTLTADLAALDRRTTTCNVLTAMA